MRRAAFLLITAIALALMASSARAMILITADRGGLITDYAERFLSARATGEQVVIDGAGLSACTLVVGMLPRDKICATPKAVVRFPRGLAADEKSRQGQQPARQPGDDGRLSRGPAKLDRATGRPHHKDDFPAWPRACRDCSTVWNLGER
jgi:hypothetical protein